MRFNNDKCTVWNLDPGKLWYQCRLGDGGIQSSPEVEDLGVLLDVNLNMSHQCVLASQSKCVLGCIPNSRASMSREVVRWFCPSTLLL